MYWWALALLGLVRLSYFRLPPFADETYILANLEHFVTNRTIIPVNFYYPPLIGYLAVPAGGIVALIGGLLSGLGPTEWAILDSAAGARVFVLGPRAVVLGLALCTIAILWRMAPRRGGAAAGLLAVVVYGFSPHAVRYAAYVMPDVGLMLGVAGATWMALRYLESPSRRQMIAAGAFIGLAAAFKYNGALCCLAVMAAAALGAGEPRRRFADLVVAALVSIAVFLVLAPSWVLTPAASYAGLKEVSRIVATTAPGSHVVPVVGTFGVLVKTDPGFAAAFLMGLIALALRRTRRLAVLMIVPVVNFAMVSRWELQHGNYFFPAMAGVSACVPEALRALKDSAAPGMKWVLALAAVLFLRLQYTDPLPLGALNVDRMSAWLAENLPPDADVVRAGLYTPKIWDTKAVEEFRSGRGARLSEEGKARFEKWLATQPRAARSIGLMSVYSARGEESLASQFPSGRWLITIEGTTQVPFWSDSKDPHWSEWERDMRVFYTSILAEEDGWRIAMRIGAPWDSPQYAIQREAPNSFVPAPPVP